MTQTMDVVGSLRKIARELIDIGAEINEPPELVARVKAASFLLNWIADGLDRELALAVERSQRVHRE